MTFCAASASFQRPGSSDFALSSARRRVDASTSKMPPQQSDGLLDVFNQLFRFSAHVSNQTSRSIAGNRSCEQTRDGVL
jgi:hypothetical protein